MERGLHVMHNTNPKEVNNEHPPDGYHADDG